MAFILLQIYYIIVLGLASSGLSRTPPLGNEEPNYYERCLDEALDKNRGVTVSDDGNTKVILVDASIMPYYCSLGMYTEELKFHHGSKLSKDYIKNKIITHNVFSTPTSGIGSFLKLQPVASQ